MSLKQVLESATAKLEESSARMQQARAEPATVENLRIWLDTLTDYTTAMAEIQSYNNESVHEKLHELAGKIGLRQFPRRRAASW